MAKEKINFEDEQVRLKYRHTASHVMAQAIKNIWPDAKLAIGPAIDNGFYYDIDMEHKLSDQDLLKIQKEMKWLLLMTMGKQKLTMTLSLGMAQKINNIKALANMVKLIDTKRL